MAAMWVKIFYKFLSNKKLLRILSNQIFTYLSCAVKNI